MPAIAEQSRLISRDTALQEALSRYDANLATFRDLSARLRKPNRATLFDTLAATRISLVIVTIGHDDDGGRLENLAVIAADPSMRLPQDPITLSLPLWGLPEPLDLELSIPHAIERMAFDCLEESFGSYPSDFAGSDTLIFDVVNRAVAITKPAPARSRKKAGASASRGAQE